MQDILFEYKMHPTTWVYISALMTIGIFFKFHRFWSVRNLDLIGLIAFSPGLLLVSYGQEQLGYLWLFGVSGFFLVRMLLDPVMVRRPLLEPNLSAGGLTFTGAALLVFLMVNVVMEGTVKTDIGGAERSEHVAAGRAGPAVELAVARNVPGCPLFYKFAAFADDELPVAGKAAPGLMRRMLVRRAAVQGAAILGHLAVVIGMVLVGYRHFDNIQTGMATASLYLLLPYTAEMTGRVDHVVPAALLVWTLVLYRRPVLAGILLGLAAGLIYYPLFLLPLWCGFYWRRGLIRFVIGVVSALVLMVVALHLTAGNFELFLDQLRQTFGLTGLFPRDLSGFWGYYEPAFRIPVLAAFVALCASLALWPAQKNLGTLLSCSAVVMLGAQFWHAEQGGLYMAWYLPLLILTIFRPNLEDRVAIAAVR